MKKVNSAALSLNVLILPFEPCLVCLVTTGYQTHQYDFSDSLVVHCFWYSDQLWDSQLLATIAYTTLVVIYDQFSLVKQARVFL